MAAALRAAKQALRAELKRRLRALSEAEKQRQSRLLSRKVIGHSKYQESQRIAIFLSMQDEIETEEIIKDIFQRGKECFIPQYKPQSSHMDMVKLTSAEEISSLPLTSWNIHQPCDNDVREEALSGAISSDDLVHVVRFKNTFTADLTKHKEGTNVIFLKVATALNPRFKNLKCLPKSERDEVWIMLSDILKERHPSVETTQPEQPKKKINLLVVASVKPI